MSPRRALTATHACKMRHDALLHERLSPAVLAEVAAGRVQCSCEHVW